MKPLTTWVLLFALGHARVAWARGLRRKLNPDGLTVSSSSEEVVSSSSEEVASNAPGSATTSSDEEVSSSSEEVANNAPGSATTSSEEEAQSDLSIADPATEVPRSVVPSSRLFFLFLVYDRISNEEIWDRFFSPAVQGVDYRAFVHCKSENDCRQNIRSKHLFEIIQSVETTYCEDLVSGMNALLKTALLAGSGGPNDKFLFLSDSTLPVKPFSVVQHRLTVDAGSGSDFCVFPRSAWAEMTTSFPGDPLRKSSAHVAVKHHQWVVLNRAHAQIAVDRTSQYRGIMEQYQLNKVYGYANQGCLDEFWHFSAIYPELDVSDNKAFLYLPGFNGGPLATGNNEVQGQCDTFLHWTPRNQGMNNNLTRLAQKLVDDPGTDLTPADEWRPSSFKRLSKGALTELRKSNFLFARKVEDACPFSGCVSLDEAFDSLVFADPPRELLGDEPTWEGQGDWLDNRQSRVTLTGVDGAVMLTWSNGGTSAKGSYCGDRISVQFSNGFKASAILTSGGAKLLWSNGVAWDREATA